MSSNISTIERFTKRGGKRRLIEANGDANWRTRNPQSDDQRALGISLNSVGDVEFRFTPTNGAAHEYVVTLTRHELQRAADLLATR